MSEVIEPRSFYELPDENQIDALVRRVPTRWANGGRDSIGTLANILEEIREHKIFRKVGCSTWAEYCDKYLQDSSAGFDLMIEGVRVLQRKNVPGPYSHTDAMRAAIDNAPDLAEPIPHDERGKKGGRGKKAISNGNSFPGGGNNAAYLAARIKRDAPEIAARIDEFPSIRAAAIAAGIIKSEKPLTVIRRAWKNASAKEREQIIAWINQQAD